MLIATAAMLLLLSAPARADHDEPQFMVPLEGSTTRWSAPPLTLNGDDVSRRLVGAAVPSATRFYGLGAGLDLTVLPGQVSKSSALGFSIPLLRLRLAWSDGSGPTSGTVGGAPVTVTRGPETLVEIGFPGLLQGGGIVGADRFLFRFGFDMGWAYLSAKATVEDASGSTQRGSADAGSFYAHIPLAACVLAHPVTARETTLRYGEDVCLTFTPTPYEFGWFPGFSAGIRVDL